MSPVSLFSVMDEDVAVKAMAALAQSSRLKVFRAILGTGPQGIQPGQLSAALEIPANTLSFHLKELQHAALVSVQREGRFLRYRADLHAMQSLMDFLTAHCCQGVPCGNTLNLACDSRQAFCLEARKPADGDGLIR